MQGLGNQAVWLAASDEYCMQGQTLIFGASFGGDLAYASPSFLPFLSTTTKKRGLPGALFARASCRPLTTVVVVVVVVEVVVTTGNRTQALLTT